MARSGYIDMELEGTARLRAAVELISDELDVRKSKAVSATLDYVRDYAREHVPRKSGELYRSIKRRPLSVVSRLDYGPVIEFAKRGRYAGLTARYGPPPRFFYRPLEEAADRMIEQVADAIELDWTNDG